MRTKPIALGKWWWFGQNAGMLSSLPARSGSAASITSPQSLNGCSAPCVMLGCRINVWGRHGCGRNGSVDLDLARARMGDPVAHTVLAGGGIFYAAAGVALFGTVFAAVYHAEMVAHRVGEPFGTLILALAVTVIETALIVSVMIAAPAEKAGLARDTVFAAVMIVCNGIVGACLLWGGVRHHEQGFQAPGSERSPGGPRCADRSHDGSSEPCGPRTRSIVQQAAAHLRRSCVAGAIFRIRLHPDGAPSRLFPAGQEFKPGGTSAPAGQQNDCPERSSPRRLARSDRWPSQGPDAHGGTRNRLSPGAKSGSRHHHRCAWFFCPRQWRLSRRPKAIGCKPA